MSTGDILGLVLSYVYAFSLLFGVEAIGRHLKWRRSWTRKLIHIGAGLWIWGILALFDHWYFGIIPFGTFIVLNYLFYRQQSFKAMDGETSTPGTVYFAISITTLFAALWRTGGAVDRAPVAAAAVMAMTLGDAVASIVGEQWGKHRYAWGDSARSWEGTAAMAIVTWPALWLTLWLLPGSALSPNSAPIEPLGAAVTALVGTVVATLSEMLSPAGTDNLSVPLFSAAAMLLIGRIFGG